MPWARRVLLFSCEEDVAVKNDRLISLILDDAIGSGGVNNRRAEI